MKDFPKLLYAYIDEGNDEPFVVAEESYQDFEEDTLVGVYELKQVKVVVKKISLRW
jgi:hypothetical protein